MIKANAVLVNSGRFYVTDDIAPIIGCGGWSFDTPGSGVVTEKLARARHYAVDPRQAGKGIGRAIFEQSAKDAFAAGAIRMQAFSSFNAKPFYERMGLVKLATTTVSMGPGTLHDSDPERSVFGLCPDNAPEVFCGSRLGEDPVPEHIEACTEP